MNNHQKILRSNSGFSLLELALTVMILGILSTSLLLIFSMTAKGIAVAEQHAIALDLVKARIELILGQKKMHGFDNFDDPCLSRPMPAVCLLPSGYNISSTITPNWNGNRHIKLVTVTVSSSLLTDGISLSSLVSDYPSNS